jgi:hypothetical protein
MKNKGKFGTAINCIDGRVQASVTDWIKLHTGVQYVDMITEPGADRLMASEGAEEIVSIFDKLNLSIRAHQSRIVAVCGHFDCAANPVDPEKHKVQIEESVELIGSWNLGIRIVGLYVNEWDSVDLIYDSDSEFNELRSYL